MSRTTSVSMELFWLPRPPTTHRYDGMVVVSLI